MFRVRLMIDVALAVAIFAAIAIVGWRASEELALRAGYERLYRDVGDMQIPDPNKAYVRALDTGDPLHFAWRCYFPANFAYAFADSVGTSTSTSTSHPAEFVLRIRFRRDEHGQWHSYRKLDHSSSAGNIGNQRFSKFLTAYWDRLRVERLGENGIEELPSNEPATLLRLSVPDDLLEAARLQFDEGPEKAKLPMVLEYEFRRP